MKNVIRETAAAAALSLVIALPAMITLRAQAPRQPGLPDLVGALKSTPGVVGVELAQTVSGKNVIFAWFENKQAALKWYYSDTHQALMLQLGSGSRRPAGPMADVPDDGRPVLAVASITMPRLGGNSPESVADLKNSVTQIAIELYAPLPGGIAVGGRFAPAALKVPGLVDRPLAAAPALAPAQ